MKGRIDLRGEWQLGKCGSKDRIAAKVPGDTHSALLAAGRIPDPYYGMNELDVQWVGREDWAYSRSFEVDAELLQAKSVFLNCESLDTVAKVFINGKLAGESDNMFARRRFEVKPLLRKGRNEIEVRIKSPEREAAERAKALPYPVPHGANPVQSMHRNLVRKVQCHSGWDWGPCLMVSGIYGEIFLQAVEAGRIEHVYSLQRHSKGLCAVDVFCEIVSPEGGETELEVSLGEVKSVRRVKLSPGMNKVSSTLAIKSPKLWWPNGYGEQNLYKLRVKACGDLVEKSLGLRSLEQVNKEDKDGLSMFFRVNGVDVFSKGADWIPCDALPQRQTVEAIDGLLSSAAKTGMNMIRVWGGGQYECDEFYELCDRKGLMVWQDFMFACSLYPADKGFLESVRQEAEYQVKRLMDHACIAIWCGDNENIGALNWFEESKKCRDRYLVDYDRLNEGVLGNIVDALDPSRKFWPSSPCGGRGNYSDCWHDDTRGDMHYWGVWHEGKPFEAFYGVKPRFCSEFGYQSFPSMDSIRSYASEEQFNVSSPAMEHHQRHPGGNTKIIAMTTRYFRMPEGFANFVYLSQVQQAVAIKTAVEHWRRLRPYCMGTIYWQLNDNWPVCSWASIEYGGKWKPLHYLSAHFFSQVMVAGVPGADGGFEVWAVNDLLAAVDAELKLSFMDFDGRELKSERLPAKLKRESARMIKSCKVSDIPAKPEECFVRLELSWQGGSVSNEVFLAKWKSVELPEAKVSLAASASKDGKLSVRLSTDKLAFYLCLNVDGVEGEFDDNCLTLLPGKGRTLSFTPKRRLGLEEFKRKLSFRHLRMTY